MSFRPAILRTAAGVRLGVGALALAVGLSTSAFAQEEQQPPVQQPPQAQSADQPDPAPNPNRPPVTSQDRIPPAKAPQDAVPPTQDSERFRSQDPQGGPQDTYAPPPAQLTIPAGTVLIMRLNEPLSSDHNQVGDPFTGTLQQPIVVGGWVVARRGETVIGKVKAVQKAGRVKGVSQLGVELTDLTLVDGVQAPILTELWKASAGTSHGADAATIGGTTALGAIIGSAADWGRGAAIGAGAGAVAGIGAVLLTRGRPTILEPESQLTFRLMDPVRVDTTHSQQAFLPVSQEDFDSGHGRPRLHRAGYGPYPYPAPCGYYYPCYYGPAYVGIYPSFGWWGFYGRGFRRF